jgi:two-component system response regulator AlgR
MTLPLRVLIVDDEPLAIERLQILLERCENVVVAGAANGGQRALKLVEELRPDACFLDVGMPRMDGIDLARALGTTATPPKIVFVTAYDRFAVAAFDVDAVDYIVKPVDPARLTRALARVREHHRSQPELAKRAKFVEDFWAGDHQGMTRIRAADVDRITAERDYMRLHAGRRSWLINDSMTRLEQALDPAEFVRLHRGAIVRRSFVAGLRRDDNGWIARLADGGEQRVGRLYVDGARDLVGRTRPAG